jgi:glycosyltransferase involved in cell wall biosynthesis
MTGMGKIIPLADPAALARAILEILDHPERYRGSPSVDLSQFAPVNIAARYEAIFASL